VNSLYLRVISFERDLTQKNGKYIFGDFYVFETVMCTLTRMLIMRSDVRMIINI